MAKRVYLSVSIRDEECLSEDVLVISGIARRGVAGQTGTDASAPHNTQRHHQQTPNRGQDARRTGDNKEEEEENGGGRETQSGNRNEPQGDTEEGGDDKSHNNNMTPSATPPAATSRMLLVGTGDGGGGGGGGSGGGANINSNGTTNMRDLLTWRLKDHSIIQELTNRILSSGEEEEDDADPANNKASPGGVDMSQSEAATKVGYSDGRIL